MSSMSDQKEGGTSSPWGIILASMLLYAVLQSTGPSYAVLQPAGLL